MSSSSRLAQRGIQSVEDNAGLLHEFSIVFCGPGQACDHCIQALGLESIELAILQINIVNNLSDSLERLVRIQSEPFEYCFKGAVFALMSEFDSEHIERNSPIDGLSLIHEVEARTLVDELSDQPGRCEAIDV